MNQLIYLSLVLSTFFNLNVANKKTEIDKFLTKNGIYSSPISDKLIKKNTYLNSKLITSVDYSRVGCNAVDSTLYYYDSNNKLLDEIHYSAIDVKPNCQAVFVITDKSHYYYHNGHLIKTIVTDLNGKATKSIINTTNHLNIQDSLQLVKNYLQDINFICEVIKKENIHKTVIKNGTLIECRVNDIPYEILNEYGVPDNALLKFMKVYIDNKYLIKDEFQFKDFLVTRDYLYKNGILSTVTIKTSASKINKNGTYLESFVVN